MTSAERPETIYFSITSAKQKQQKSGTGSEADGLGEVCGLFWSNSCFAGFVFRFVPLRGGEAKPGTTKNTKQNAKIREIRLLVAKGSHFQFSSSSVAFVSSTSCLCGRDQILTQSTQSLRHKGIKGRFSPWKVEIREQHAAFYVTFSAHLLDFALVSVFLWSRFCC